ncbi:MAG: sulfate adenylyltransferase subunit CysN [Sphingomonas sp.]
MDGEPVLPRARSNDETLSRIVPGLTEQGPDTLPDPPAAADVETYLASHRSKTLLRFLTCGSVDDGKSTLIGRLLYDTKTILEDQLATLAEDSRRVGTRSKTIDFALLLDGLSAEREQGITIDVAYRFFATERRKFIVADTPGHEQYTRNMVTGASTADLAIILVDARKGILTQTRRHTCLVHLLGVRNIVLAVNKMDLVGYDRATFDAIVDDYRDFAATAGITAFTAIPVCGRNGDNIAARSPHCPWYEGPTLLDHLESVPLDAEVDQERPFCMPVQWVNRANLDFRGFAGLIASGEVRPGDAVRVLPAGRTSSIARIVTAAGDLDMAVAGQAVTLTLVDEVDCPRGGAICAAGDPPQCADQFEAKLFWMDEAPMVPGRSYWLKCGPQLVSATVQPPKYQLGIDTMEHLAAKSLELNAIGVTELTTDRPIVFAPYAESKALGGFILIDKVSNATIGAGVLNFALRRAQNTHRQHFDVDREQRMRLKNQTPMVLWFTGLSGAGKSTIANKVEQRLCRMHRHTFLLDGDNIRQGLNRDLGFTEVDRIENLRRVGEVARLMTDAGLIVIAAFISPFRTERKMVRELIGDGQFVEIFVDTPLAVAEERDVKGLYAKARSGALDNFTGIDSRYESPLDPDIRIDTMRMTADEAADLIVTTIIP